MINSAFDSIKLKGVPNYVRYSENTFTCLVEMIGDKVRSHNLFCYIFV